MSLIKICDINLDMTKYSNGEHYYLKQYIIDGIAMNYPEDKDELYGLWIKIDKYGYQSTGSKKLFFEFKSNEVIRMTNTTNDEIFNEM